MTALALLREDNMIKPVLIALGLSLAALPAMADVGVSINIGEPHFFGRIDIGDAPRPVLRMPRPVYIERQPVDVVVEPVYLHVPLSESRDWRRYCHRYDACGRPVYFVQDTWYRNVYVPHYRDHRDEFERRYHDRHEEHREWKDEQRERKEERHDDRREERENNRHDKHGHGHDDHDRD